MKTLFGRLGELPLARGDAWGAHLQQTEESQAVPIPRVAWGSEHHSEVEKRICKPSLHRVVRRKPIRNWRLLDIERRVNFVQPDDLSLSAI
jgi:hypothetical protein